MEEESRYICNVVYLCTGQDEEVYELHHQRSPPAAPAATPGDSSSLAQAYKNVRALLDEDQGGFSEGKPAMCLMTRRVRADVVQCSCARDTKGARSDSRVMPTLRPLWC